MSDKGKCANRYCSDPAYCVGLCTACYSRVRYWLKKSPAQLMERRHKIDRSIDTLESLLGHDVTVMSKKRRKRA